MSGALNIADLFTPAPSGVDPANPAATPPAGSWLASLYQNAVTLKLSTTAWATGGMVRTGLALMATALATTDGLVSIMAQGGFLDFAAAVTPDPATLGTAAKPGWLDVLASSNYNATRIAATYAGGTEYVANTSANTYGPFAAGLYHVSNPGASKTYANTSSLTINPSTVAGTAISGAANDGTGKIKITTSAAHGLTSGAVVYLAGVLGIVEANGFWSITVNDATHYTLNGSAFVNAWTSGGKTYSTQSFPARADLAGASSTAAIGAISQPVTSQLGVVVANLVAFVGNNPETNAGLVARCRAKLGSLSPNGPAQAYSYIALSASQLLGTLTPAVSLLNGAITRVLASQNLGTGTVTTTIANATGATDGAINRALTAATNASPIVLSAANTAGIAVGDWIYVAGVQGNTAANGYHQAASIVANVSITLESTSAGNGAYTTGGTIEAGDLGLVDNLLQSLCVPLGVTAITQWAGTTAATVAMTVYVPASQVSAVVSAASTAVTAYFAALPIGGYTTGVPVANTVPIEGIEAAVNAATLVGGTSYVRDMTITLNGVAADLAIPATNVATLAWSGGTPATAITVVTF